MKQCVLCLCLCACVLGRLIDSLLDVECLPACRSMCMGWSCIIMGGDWIGLEWVEWEPELATWQPLAAVHKER